MDGPETDPPLENSRPPGNWDAPSDPSRPPGTWELPESSGAPSLGEAENNDETSEDQEDNLPPVRGSWVEGAGPNSDLPPPADVEEEGDDEDMQKSDDEDVLIQENLQRMLAPGIKLEERSLEESDPERPLDDAYRDTAGEGGGDAVAGKLHNEACALRETTSSFSDISRDPRAFKMAAEAAEAEDMCDESQDELSDQAPGDEAAHQPSDAPSLLTQSVGSSASLSDQAPGDEAAHQPSSLLTRSVLASTAAAAPPYAVGEHIQVRIENENGLVEWHEADVTGYAGEQILFKWRQNGAEDQCFSEDTRPAPEAPKAESGSDTEPPTYSEAESSAEVEFDEGDISDDFSVELGDGMALPVEVVPALRQASTLEEDDDALHLSPQMQELRDWLVLPELCDRIGVAYHELRRRLYVRLPPAASAGVAGRDGKESGAVRAPVSFKMKGGLFAKPLGIGKAAGHTDPAMLQKGVAVVDLERAGAESVKIKDRGTRRPLKPVDEAYRSRTAPLALFRAYASQNWFIGSRNGFISFENDDVEYPAETLTPVREHHDKATCLHLASLWLLYSLRDQYDACATKQLCDKHCAKRVHGLHAKRVLQFLQGRPGESRLLLMPGSLAALPEPQPRGLLGCKSSQPPLSADLLRKLPETVDTGRLRQQLKQERQSLASVEGDFRRASKMEKASTVELWQAVRKKIQAKLKQEIGRDIETQELVTTLAYLQERLERVNDKVRNGEHKAKRVREEYRTALLEHQLKKRRLEEQRGGTDSLTASAAEEDLIAHLLPPSPSCDEARGQAPARRVKRTDIIE